MQESTNFTMEWIGLEPRPPPPPATVLQFQYSVAVSDKVVMGAGLTFNGGNDVVGVYPVTGGDIVTRINSRASIDFLPGYAVSNKVLVCTYQNFFKYCLVFFKNLPQSNNFV